MSLVPPTFRQSRKTVRPVFALYQLLEAERELVADRLVVGRDEDEGVVRLRRRGRLSGAGGTAAATVATSARMMSPRLSIGDRSAGQDDHVLGAGARKELLGLGAVDENAGLSSRILSVVCAGHEIVLGVFPEIDRLADPAPHPVLGRTARRNRPAFGADGNRDGGAHRRAAIRRRPAPRPIPRPRCPPAPVPRRPPGTYRE